MKCNVSKPGQALRLLAGMVLMAWAVAGGPVWTWVGILIAATGAWRLCPLLLALGVRRFESDPGQAREDARSRPAPPQDS